MKFYAAEMILALKYLHSKGVIYRDLKPENVVLDKHGHIRLVDFGMAKPGMEIGRAYTICGSYDYIAPEVILGIGYSFPVDYWSLGCVLYELLFGLPPFFCKSGQNSDKFPRILKGNVKFPSKMDPCLKHLLQGLLTVVTHERLGEGLQEHAFFSTVDWSSYLQKEIMPPIKPKILHDTETRYFDKEFTSMPASLQYIGSFSQIDPSISAFSSIHEFPVEEGYLV
eukprot:CAMPEP_0117856312 /NCGR_PEP_ID=MMETSP0950-20121206/1173_1 /TAXON_ID=44440 /ORGANISM="Chattonella subsalsa, Strain CCMP2191" /LENGTH=224 /DNA_ID=CAMNT_0005705391 /DNA_START=622 /DNA_END=1296 /DNA_ORIENTATION=-